MRALEHLGATLLLIASALASPADAAASIYCLPSNVKIVGTAARTQAPQDAATGSSTCATAITHTGGDHDYSHHRLMWDGEIMLYSYDAPKDEAPKPAYCLPRKTKLIALSGSLIAIGNWMQTHQFLEARIESDRKAKCKLSNAPPPSTDQLVYVREEDLKTAFEMDR